MAWWNSHSGNANGSRLSKWLAEHRPERHAVLGRGASELVHLGARHPARGL